MPALPSVPKTLRVALKHNDTSADPDVVTRFFIQYSGTAPSNSDLNTFCAAVGTAWTNHLAALHNATVQLAEVTAEDLTSPTSAVGTALIGSAGTLSGTLLGAGTAAVFSYAIGRRYRGGHPRAYWQMGVGASLATRNEWTSAFAIAADTAMPAFFTDVLAAGWALAGSLSHVNVSYFSGFTVITNPITHRARNVPTLRVTPVVDTVTSVALNPKIGSQRRRNLQSA